MRWLLFAAWTACAALAAMAVEEPSIIKVLPHFLDKEGRNALRPSLYERDAYQKILRTKPEMCSALRFDVQWSTAGRREITMRAEARGTRQGVSTRLAVERKIRKTGIFEHWGSIPMEGEAYKGLGELVAWRVQLIEDGRIVAEQRSFLWGDLQAVSSPATSAPPAIIPSQPVPARP